MIDPRETPIIPPVAPPLARLPASSRVRADPGTPVSPSDLLSFCDVDFMMSGMMEEGRRLGAAEQAREADLTSGRRQQIFAAHDEIDPCRKSSTATHN